MYNLCTAYFPCSAGAQNITSLWFNHTIFFSKFLTLLTQCSMHTQNSNSWVNFSAKSLPFLLIDCPDGSGYSNICDVLF